MARTGYGVNHGWPRNAAAAPDNRRQVALASPQPAFKPQTGLVVYRRRVPRLRRLRVRANRGGIIACQRPRLTADYAAMSRYLGPVVTAAVIGLVASLIATSPGAAETRREQERQARKACLTGDYAKGVAILSDLFIDTKDPTYIFNQGRCFEQNRRYDEAIGRFDEYLQAGKGKLTAADRSAAEQHIAHSKDMLAQENAISPPAPVMTAPPTPVTPAAATASETPASPPAVVKTEAPAPAKEGSGMRVAGIVTASVGVAAAAAGVIFSLEANSLLTAMEKNNAWSSGKESEWNAFRVLGWTGYGVGAACIVTGAILYGVGLRASSGSGAQVALLPSVAANQVGATIAGAF